MYEEIIRPILFALSRGDAEKAHELTRRAAAIVQNVPGLLGLVSLAYGNVRRPVEVAGIRFPNRVGLAAGFDKQATMLPLLQAVGFGFVEIGTVLPRPQKGNDRPRLFRFPQQKALCNRMGFNSDGAVAIASRLAAVHERIRIPIGLSLGKQKETELKRAADDYVEVLNTAGDCVDFFTVNVSSPNTPGLRELQTRDYLENLVRRVVQAERTHAAARLRAARPVLVKLAPDLTEEEAEVAIGAATDAGVSGFICSNTSNQRRPPGITKEYCEREGVSGGWSGPHLYFDTIRRITLARSWTKLPLIACGGISSPEHVRIISDAGANLVQVMTSFIYEGPSLVRRLAAV